MNALRVALRIISGKIIYNFGVQESLRTFLNPIFTGGGVAGNGICSAAFCESAALRVCSLPLGGAVAQRLRGFKSAEPEKTVKRSSRRTGVNLQFFPVQPSSLGLKGASSPFFVAPARRNRWHFSGSLLVSKENISVCIPSSPAIPNLHTMQLLLAKLLSFSGKYCILVSLSASIACQNIRIFEKKHLSMQTRKRGQPL